jgi:cell wall-associated NlpC family hydrolase
MRYSRSMGDDAIKDAAGKAANAAREGAKTAASVARLVGSGGADVSAWWSLIKQWGGRLVKLAFAIGLIFIQILAATTTANAECGGGAADPANGPAYSTTNSKGGGEDMNIVKLVYDITKKRYGTNPDGNRILLATMETAETESTFHNYGDLGANNDHDSLGVFQQRPSSGWGTPAQVTNPTYATNKYLDKMDSAHIAHPSVPAHELAQHVQGSACDGKDMPNWCNDQYGGNYLKSEARAKALIAQMGGFFPDTGTSGTMNVANGSPTVQQASTDACTQVMGGPVAIGTKDYKVTAAHMVKRPNGKVDKVFNNFQFDIPVGQRGKVIQAGLTQLGVTYVFGADSWGNALDCSSFAKGAVKRGAGIQMPRTAHEQYAWAKKKGSLSYGSVGSLKPGDLIFWTSADGGPSQIHHVAIYLGKGFMDGKETQLMIAAPHTGDIVKIQAVYPGNMYWADPGYDDSITA